jgi:hypothetical protein
MNWEQVRSLAEDHQSRTGVTAASAPRKRTLRPRRARRRIGWALVDVGLRLAVGQPGRSIEA